jgi:hypothetical protein
MPDQSEIVSPPSAAAISAQRTRKSSRRARSAASAVDERWAVLARGSST